MSSMRLVDNGALPWEAEKGPNLWNAGTYLTDEIYEVGGGWLLRMWPQNSSGASARRYWKARGPLPRGRCDWQSYGTAKAAGMEFNPQWMAMRSSSRPSKDHKYHTYHLLSGTNSGWGVMLGLKGSSRAYIKDSDRGSGCWMQKEAAMEAGLKDEGLNDNCGVYERVWGKPEEDRLVTITVQARAIHCGFPELVQAIEIVLLKCVGNSH